MDLTLGDMQSKVTRWMKGDLVNAAGQLQIIDAVNDAIQSIWMTMMQWKLARFIGVDSPVSFSLPNNSERVLLISVPDPTIALVTSQVTGGVLAARTYKSGYTFVTESGSETNIKLNADQAIGANNLFTAIAPAFPVADIPQTPAGPPPPGIVGWNLYAGVVEMGLQNQDPIPFKATYQEIITGFQDYPTAQQLPPTSNTTADNISYISHLEAQLPDTTWQAWNQQSLDGLFMRRRAATYPTGSQYASYAWDLINGQSIEVRPKTGTSFTPRYWYIAKPRFLRYLQAQVPYLNIAGVDDFIWQKAIATCKLSLEEYIANQAWDAKAEAKRTEIIMALNQENWSLDTRVVPYLR